MKNSAERHKLYILLEEEGAHGKITIHDYLWELIPLDYDLLSLEIPSFFTSTFVHEETSLLSSVANSILGMQSLFGQIKNRVAIGKHSVTVLDQLQLLEQSQHVKSVLFLALIFNNSNRYFSGEIVAIF